MKFSKIKNIEQITLKTVNWYFYKNRLVNYFLIKKILSYSSENINLDGGNERAFPGDEEFRKSGYYKKMLKRYFFAGDFFCRGKSVLDTCSGTGWGTYILSRFAKEITAFDKSDDAIAFSRKQWRAKNINWEVANALDLRDEWSSRFDVVVGMESIEHFNREDGEKYIQNLSRMLKKNGYLIGTSAFPDNRKKADEICRKNPYHLYIFTLEEISAILKQYFKQFKIVNNWIFIGKK